MGDAEIVSAKIVSINKAKKKNLFRDFVEIDTIAYSKTNTVLKKSDTANAAVVCYDRKMVIW